MPLRFTYLQSHAVPVELKGFTPDSLGMLKLAEIERLAAFVGNQKVPLAELFRVEGDPADQKIELSGDLSGVHWIGAKMTGGTIRVEGPVGRHLGSEMQGGSIHASGDAGDWAGGEMHGGLIHIRGSAGNLVGAAYRGSRRGMTGGTLLVDGTVGNEIGHSMRRGLIAVGGCGDFAGINMIAGTILVFGEAGFRTGAGMRRGTIGLLGRPSAANPADLPPRRERQAADHDARAARARTARLSLLAITLGSELSNLSRRRSDRRPRRIAAASVAASVALLLPACGFHKRIVISEFAQPDFGEGVDRDAKWDAEDSERSSDESQQCRVGMRTQSADTQEPQCSIDDAGLSPGGRHDLGAAFIHCGALTSCAAEIVGFNVGESPGTREFL